MIRHSGIFYPDDKDELLRLTEGGASIGRHKAWILPHMRLSAISDLYKTAFASSVEYKRVVAILPIHRELLEKDEGKDYLASPSRIEKTHLGSIKIESLGPGDASPYEEEEYTLELLYPFIAHYMPSSPLCPIFTKLCNASASKRLSAFLSSIDDGNTLFILSSNMTSRMRSCEVEAERNAMIALLEEGEHLADKYMKGRISACGALEAEALSRLGSGKWHLYGIGSDESMAGHAALWMD